MEPESEEEAVEEIAKALKAYINQEKEGTLRYTDMDIPTVQGGDTRDPVNYPTQGGNGRELGYRYIQV